MQATSRACRAAPHPKRSSSTALASRTTAPEQSRWPGPDVRKYKVRANARLIFGMGLCDIGAASSLLRRTQLLRFAATALPRDPKRVYWESSSRRASASRGRRSGYRRASSSSPSRIEWARARNSSIVEGAWRVCSRRKGTRTASICQFDSAPVHRVPLSALGGHRSRKARAGPGALARGRSAVRG